MGSVGKRVAVVVCLAAGLVGGAMSQEPPVAEPPGEGSPPARPRELLVTASRVAAPRERSGVTASVVAGEEVEARHHTEVQEALRGVPGMHFVRTGNRGGTTSLFLRGGEADYTSVMLDGYRINVDGGSFDFENLAADNVDRIEVVRGAASPLYGSDAMAGVVNVVSARGEGPPTATVSSEAGSFGTLRERLRVSGGEGGNGYSVDATYLTQQDGRYENSDFRDLSVAGRFDHRLSPETTMAVTLRELRSTVGVFTTSAGQRFDPPDPNDSILRNDSLAGLTVEHVPDGMWETQIRMFRYLRERKFDTREDRSIDARHGDTANLTTLSDFERLGVDAQAAWTPAAEGRIVGGLAYEQDTLFLETVRPGATNSTDVDDGRNTASLFAEGEWSWEERLFLTVGARRDDSTDFDSATSHRQSLAWLFDGGMRLRAAHGTGIKAPTFAEIHGTATTPGLKTKDILDVETEKARTWDVGVERPFWGGRATASLTGFLNEYTDLVELESSALGYSQGGAARARGLEAEVDVAPRSWLRTGATWTYLETTVSETRTTGTAFVRGEPLLRRPRNAGILFIEWRPTRAWEATAQLTHVGDRIDRDFKASSGGQRLENSDYRTLDASASWRFRDGWRLFAAGRNLTDATYEEAYGYPADRAWFLAGVECAFGI